MEYSIIKNLIAKGKISEALEKLTKYVNSSNIPEKSDILLLSSRYNLLLNESRKGIVAIDVENIHINRIVSHLLSYLNDLEISYPKGFDVYNIAEIEVAETNNGIHKKMESHNRNNYQYTSSFNQQYLIEDIFINPTITENKNAKSEIDIIRILEFTSKKIIMHSDSFTGKSTLLKYLCNSVTQPVFFIPLNKYNGNILSLISETYDIKKESITRFIEENNDCWAFFDAFDEIQSNELQIQFISELDRFPQFVMTSRTYALSNYTLPSTSILKIQPYSTDNIYLLVDKRMNDTGNILNFYNSLRSSNQSNDDYLLRYPWLVIFLIEHFEAGNFSLELLDDLPFEIMAGLQKKLRTSKIAEDRINNFINETGNLLFDRLFTGNLNIREIHKDEISKENIEVFKTLTSFGLISTPSHLSSVYSISIPLLPELLIAYHLCNRNKHDLIQLLSHVYCRAEYKEIIVLSAKIWVSKGNDIKDFDPKTHQFTCNGYFSANRYEHLLYYLTLRNIPSNLCYKFDSLISGYFEQLKNIFEKRDEDYFEKTFELNSRQLAEREIKEAFEEKIIDYLQFFNRKSEKHIDDFYKFVKKINRSDLDPGLGIAINKNYKYIINCKSFSIDILRSIQNDKYDEIYKNLIYMVNSPVTHPDIYKLLLYKLLSNNVRNYKFAELIFEDNLWILDSILLLLLKANLTNEEVSRILDLLSSFKLNLDDEQYAKNKLGTIKSTVLTNDVLEYIVTKLEQGVQFDSIQSVIYLLQDMFLFNRNNKKTEETLNRIILLCHDYFKSAAFENTNTTAHWDNIEYVYCQILKLFPLKGLEKNTYDFLQTTYNYDKQKGYHKKKVSTLLYYLINMESRYALIFLEANTCNFILTNRKLINHPILIGQFKFSLRFLDDIRIIIANDINALYNYKNEIFEFIDNELKAICIYLPNSSNSYKIIEEDELWKECKSPDFYQFLEENSDIKYFKYALIHGIFNEKPIFSKQIGNKVKYYYSCSEMV